MFHVAAALLHVKFPPTGWDVGGGPIWGKGAPLPYQYTAVLRGRRDFNSGTDDSGPSKVGICSRMVDASQQEFRVSQEYAKHPPAPKTQQPS
jgi:hypothetical protein